MQDDIIFDVSEEDFEQKVIEASRTRPVMVDIWAEWCPPCRQLTPVLERVAKSRGGRILLAKLEADENMRLAGFYRVKGFPTVMLFLDGEERGRFAGFRSEQAVREFIDEHASPPDARG
ncbi:MAG: thioredoxin fold domain-containing protein [Nitrospirae bacterium]|nr:thioredoxin fold domain-containing protein [Nitrospirota bacterium]